MTYCLILNREVFVESINKNLFWFQSFIIVFILFITAVMSQFRTMLHKVITKEALKNIYAYCGIKQTWQISWDTSPAKTNLKN